MPRCRFALVLAVAAWLTACGEAPHSANPPLKAAPQPVQAPAGQNESQSPAAIAFGAQMQPQTAYADLRDAVLRAGWLPLQIAGCAANIGGDAPACRELPELDGCSADGACLMRFGEAASSRVLTVRTYGDLRRWQDGGAAATLRVVEASVAALASAPGAACPGAGFEGFLRAFAADPAQRLRFTAPLVRVMQSRDVFENTESYPSVVRAEDFRGFPVTFAEGDFHHVDPAGAIDPVPLPLDLIAEGDGARRVSWSYGMSEGNAVTFSPAADCWQLVEDPDPPLL